jgi:hypothetical protein
MRFICLCFSLALAASAATTTVQDTVYTGSGATANCTLQIYGQAMNANGQTVIVSKTQTKVTNGVLSIPLQANDTANPQGTSYRVTYACNDGSAPTETWVVPTSATPVTLQTVRQVSVPTPILDYHFRGIVDATLATSTIPFKMTTSYPSGCLPGQVIIRSDQAYGANSYICNTVGTFVAFGGGGVGGGPVSGVNVGSAGVGVFYRANPLVAGELDFFKLNSTNTALSITQNGVDHIDLSINVGNIAHQSLSGAGTNTHAQIDSHIASTSNPHSTTASQVGAEVPLTISPPLFRSGNTISLPLDANGFLVNNGGAIALNMSCSDQDIPKFNLGLLKWQCAADSGSGGGGGITTLNAQSGASQTFVAGSAGSDFAIASASNVHTFNLPTASASARGLLSSANWSTFNGKESPLTFNGPLSRSTNAISCSTCEVTTAKNAASGYAGLDSGSRIVKAQAPSTTAYTDAANTFGSGLKQTFTLSATTAGISLGTGSDPSGPAQGDFWINGSSFKWRGAAATLTAVDTSRTISATSPLTGGGALSGNISINCPECTNYATAYTDTQAATAAATASTITKRDSSADTAFHKVTANMYDLIAASAPAAPTSPATGRMYQDLADGHAKFRHFDGTIADLEAAPVAVIVNPSVTFTAGTSIPFTFTHGLNNSAAFIFCTIDGSPGTFIPASTPIDANSVSITLPSPQNGKCYAVGNTAAAIGIVGWTSDSNGNLSSLGDVNVAGSLRSGQNSTILSGTYQSGITASGGTTGNTCLISLTGSGGIGAVVAVALSGPATLPPAGTVLNIVNPGSGYTGAPTTGTVSDGTATGCAGTPVLTTVFRNAAAHHMHDQNNVHDVVLTIEDSAFNGQITYRGGGSGDNTAVLTPGAVLLQNQTAAITSAQNVIVSARGGSYLVCPMVRTSLVTSGTGTATITIGYTDAVGTKTHAFSTLTLAANAQTFDGCTTARILPGAGLNFTVAYTGTASYDAEVTASIKAQ